MNATDIDASKMSLKHRAVSIKIHRAEGRPAECITVTHNAKDGDVWMAARLTLMAWSRTAPDGGGYDKCDFWVTYDDGEEYQGRLDITRDREDTDVGDHMRRFLECYALRRLPARYAVDPEKAAAFRRHVLADCAETHAAAGPFLDSHEIGGE